MAENPKANHSQPQSTAARKTEVRKTLMSHIRQEIVDIVTDDKIWRTKEIKSILSQRGTVASNSQISIACSILCGQNKLQRVRHGLYTGPRNTTQTSEDTDQMPKRAPLRGDPARALVLELLSDHKTWRVKAIKAALEANPSTAHLAVNTTQYCRQLCRQGHIMVVRHGVYISTQAPKENSQQITTLSPVGSFGSTKRALEALATPMTQSQLAEALNITRERARQLVNKLAEANLIQLSISRGRGKRKLWHRPDACAATLDEQTRLQLPPRAVKLLNAMKAGERYSYSTLAQHTGLNRNQMMLAMNHLKTHKMAKSLQVFGSVIVEITDEGLKYEDYDPNAVKAPTIDGVKISEGNRATILQILRLLGTGTGSEITGAANFWQPNATLATMSSAVYLPRLIKQGLIEEAQNVGTRKSYRLTENGQLTADLTSKTRPLPDKETFLKLWKNHREQQQAVKKSLGNKHLRRCHITQLSMLEAKLLNSTKKDPLTTIQIADECKALHANTFQSLVKLEKLGMVERVAATLRRGLSWNITAKGLKTLQSCKFYQEISDAENRQT